MAYKVEKLSDNVVLYCGDCLEVMAEMEAGSVDSVITDPPYGLQFMGKDWDKGVPGERFWIEALKVSKPGAMLLSFGGTRTYHRLVTAIEDAGWNVQDMIAWVYGSGFPKSHDVSKAIDREAQLWDGWGTALKPAVEPICVATKPRDGTYANNALTWGVAGLWIDGARVWHDEPIKFTERTADKFGRTHAGGNGWRGKPEEQNMASPSSKGRWPANFIHDGSDEVMALFPSPHGAGSQLSRDDANSKWDTHSNGMFPLQSGARFGDSGSAARFFYCAKASRSERNAGLELPMTNIHATVKPVTLMEYLAKLTKTPTGGVVLDPFMGSGTTGIACVKTGRPFVGIELDEDYFEIAKRRILHAMKQMRLEI